MNRFGGTNLLLTGAGSGIGRATAVRLVSEGAAVYAVDRDEAGLAATLEAAEGPGRIVAHVADIADEEQVVDAVEGAAGTFGGLEALVNVAGMHRVTPITTLSVEDLRSLYEVNLIGTALMCREALRHIPDSAGVVVNVASSAAAHGNPYMSAYSASKGAVLGFSLSLAAEVVGRGVRVVCVSPGAVATPLSAAVDFEGLDAGYYARIRSPLGPATPDQVAGTIAFAASRDAGHLTGVDLRVDGGSHI